MLTSKATYIPAPYRVEAQTLKEKLFQKQKSEEII